MIKRQIDLRSAFAAALKSLRRATGRTQEDFTTVSSRTYLSALERGLKSPTLDKIEQLASVLSVHPMTIMAICYQIKTGAESTDELFQLVRTQISALDLGGKKLPKSDR